MFSGTDIKISTGCSIVNTFCEIDIENIFYHLELNDTFIGAKYHNRYKGFKYSNIKKRTSCFFNQITLPIVVNNHEYNVKVFRDGKLQFSGIKSLEETKIIVNILMECISKIQGVNNVKLLYIDNIYYNEKEYNNFIKQKSNRFDSIKLYDIYNNICYGERKGNKIVLKHYGKTVNCIIHEELDCFIEEGITKQDPKTIIKKLFSKKDGSCIGSITHNFLHKTRMIDISKYIYTKINENTFDVLYKYNNEKLGEKVISISKPTFPEKVQDYISIPYKCITIGSTEFTYKMTNINADFRLLYNGETVMFNRERLNNIFIERFGFNSECKLDAKYPAIRLSLYYNEKLDLVKHSEDHKYANKLSIFENGKVLTFGSTNQDQITKIRSDMVNIMNQINDQSIIKREKVLVEIKDPGLTIYDILLS